MHGGHALLEGRGAVRRFAWQVGGIGVAVGACVVLGVLAFGCGGGAPVRPTATASPTPRATATVDPRVAQVDAAVRRYVQALVDSMRTGSPAELDSLSVPGSQAEGNAGISAHVVHDTGKCFVTNDLNITSVDVTLAGASTALATATYDMTGYDASFPAETPLGTARTVRAQERLQLDLVGDRWLVSQEQ